jgi:hypothetical protein
LETPVVDFLAEEESVPLPDMLDLCCPKVTFAMAVDIYLRLAP